MKTIYALLFLMFPFLLTAQQKMEQRFSIGIAQAHLHLPTSEYYEVFETGSFRSRSSITSNRSARGVGINLGYHLKVHPRWELTGRINYSGNKVEEPNHNGFSSSSTTSPLNSLPEERTRTYRAFWSEALLYWRMAGDYSLIDFQVGTGLAHLYYYQQYPSGYVYNAQFQQFDSKRTTIERKGNFGIPIQLQLQYPINYHWKIGGTAQINTFFNGSQQTGVVAFMAYRW